MFKFIMTKALEGHIKSLERDIMNLRGQLSVLEVKAEGLEKEQYNTIRKVVTGALEEAFSRTKRTDYRYLVYSNNNKRDISGTLETRLKSAVRGVMSELLEISESSAEFILKSEVQSEAFIDKIITRIKDKQLD